MSYNKVILIGNLTNDVEVKELQSGTSMAVFSLAVNNKYKKASGELVEEVSFVDVTMMGKRAETVHKFFSKGDSIMIEGKIRQSRWEDKEGNKRSKISVSADSFEFLPSKKPLSTDTKPSPKPDKDDDFIF